MDFMHIKTNKMRISKIYIVTRARISCILTKIKMRNFQNMYCNQGEDFMHINTNKNAKFPKYIYCYQGKVMVTRGVKSPNI